MPNTSNQIVLITGANTGLGFEIAKALLQNPNGSFYVLLGSRNIVTGQAAAKFLHEQGLTDCESIYIDVTQDESIAKAAELVAHKFGRLDVLHVNAGIGFQSSPGVPLPKLIMGAMETNVTGAASTTEHFIPLLNKASNPRVIFMSAGFGSGKLVSTVLPNDKYPAYSASKAALNMIMLYYWWRFPGQKVNASAPGYRSTALSNFGEGVPLKPGKLENGAINAVRLSMSDVDGESGTFTEYVDDTGEVVNVPW